MASFVPGPGASGSEDDVDRLPILPVGQRLRLGTRLAKEFPPHGVFVGTITAYSFEGRLYRITYSDGDVEDLRHEQVLALLQQSQPQQHHHQQQQPTMGAPPPPTMMSTASAAPAHRVVTQTHSSSSLDGNNGHQNTTNNTVHKDAFGETVYRVIRRCQKQGGRFDRTDLRELALGCVRHQQQHAAASGEHAQPEEDSQLHDLVHTMLLRLVQQAARTNILTEAVQVLVGSNGESKTTPANRSRVFDEWLATRGRQMLQTLGMGLEAAGIIVFLAAADGLDRRAVSDDALGACLALYKQHTKTLVPTLNQTLPSISTTSSAGTSSSSSASPKKRRRLSSGGSSSPSDLPAGSNVPNLKDLKKLYKYLGMVKLQLELTDRLETLVSKIPLDDQQILLLTHGALQTLEIWDSPHLVAAAIRLTTAAFGRYPHHRDTILNDLFPLMLKLPVAKKHLRTYRIPLNGAPQNLATRLTQVTQLLGTTSSHHSSSSNAAPPSFGIQMLTNLILSLVQSTVATPGWTDDGAGGSGDYLSGLDLARRWVHALMGQWLARCLKKSASSSSDYRVLLQHVVQDLLTVLLVPQYPSAQLVLVGLVGRLQQVVASASVRGKKSPNVDPTFCTVAFDILGKIAAVEAGILAMDKDQPIAIHESNIKKEGEHSDMHQTSGGGSVKCYCGSSRTDWYTIACDSCGDGSHGACVGVNEDSHVDEWLCDACRLGEIGRREAHNLKIQGKLDRQFILQHSYLAALSQRLGMAEVQDAMSFHLAHWVDQLEEKGTATAAMGPYRRIAQELIANHWGKESFGPCGNLLTDEGATRVLVSLMAQSTPLFLSFRKQISFILKLMADDSTSVLRKLSVKAIEKTAEGDPKIMLLPVVTKAVSSRLSDDSISVREAAVSLVGSYVVQFPAVANAFHSALSSCLTDVGLSVRKRAVRIFQEILLQNPRYRGRAAVSYLMLQRAVDPKEEDGVRDLIYELFTKLWLSNKVVTEKTPSPQIRIASHVPESPFASTHDLGALSVVTPSTPSILQTPPSQPRRSDVAATQMMEVVRSCGSGDHLERLLRKLLTVGSDSKNGKDEDRQKRAALNQKYCACLVDSLFELLLSTEEQKSTKRANRVAKDLAATLQTIAIFSQLSTEAVLKHIDTILPYFKANNADKFEDEAAIAGAVCEIVARLSTNLSEHELIELGSKALAQDLVKIIKKFGASTLSAAVDALSSLANHPESTPDNKFKTKLLDISRMFYAYLLKMNSTEDFGTIKPVFRSNTHRALTVLGHICRNQERSTSMDDPEDAVTAADIASDDISPDNLIQACFGIFQKYLKKTDPPTKCKALRGLSGIFVSQPRLMLELQQSGLIEEVIGEDAHGSIQYESLLCWKEILMAEEKRIDGGHATEKLENDKDVTLSDRISGDRDGDATLFGGILTSHSERLFEMTQSNNQKIRLAALDLIGQLLRQGLVNPNEAIPFLLALQGDVENEEVRTMALKLLLAEGERRTDLLRQRICAGVKKAYLFQRKSYPDRDQVSAIVSTKSGRASDIECVFSAIFKQGVASNKRQRQGLFKSLLSFFETSDGTNSPTAKKQRQMHGKELGSQEVNLSLLSFVTQILAHLPYTTATDPLFIIHHISSLVTLQGGDIIDKLARALRPVGLASSDEFDEANSGEDALERAAKSKFPSRTSEAACLGQEVFDQNKFVDLCQSGTGLTLLLRLKSHLRKMYNLSDARCLEYDPNAKERIGEKGVSKNDAAGAFDGRVSASTEIDVLIQQYAEFRRLMREENSLDEALKAEAEQGDPMEVATSSEAAPPSEKPSSMEVA